MTRPDQVTVAPNESIQDAEGFGLQQGPSSPSPAGEQWPDSMTSPHRTTPCMLQCMQFLCAGPCEGPSFVPEALTPRSADKYIR